MENKFERRSESTDLFFAIVCCCKKCSFFSFLLAVPGGVEKCYSCCERVVGSAGCQTAKVGMMFSESFYNAVS